jgi:hypothetical protein
VIAESGLTDAVRQDTLAIIGVVGTYVARYLF